MRYTYNDKDDTENDIQYQTDSLRATRNCLIQPRQQNIDQHIYHYYNYQCQSASVFFLFWFVHITLLLGKDNNLINKHTCTIRFYLCLLERFFVRVSFENDLVIIIYRRIRQIITIVFRPVTEITNGPGHLLDCQF